MKYFFLLLPLFLVSCIPGKVISFDSLQPAQYQLPQKIDSVLVLNMAYYPWVDTVDFNILKDLKPKEQVVIDTFIIKSVFDGLFSSLDHSYLKELSKNQYFEMRGDKLDGFLKPLDTESVNYLSEEFNTDLILSLEYYGMDFDYDKYYNYENGYVVNLKIEKILGWRIYRKGFGMIHEDFKRDTLYWSGSGRSYEEAEEKIPELIDAVKESFWYGGEDFAKKISPTWSSVDRMYFMLTDSNLGDISLDKDKLLELINTGKAVKQFKAWYNLAVVYEKEGDLNEALKALNTAETLQKESVYVDYYKKQIKASMKKREKLLNQLNSLN